MNAKKNVSVFLFGLGLMSLGMSFFHSSCLLCDIERYLVLASAACLFVDYVKIGLFNLFILIDVAAYHALIQFNILNNPSFCSARLDSVRAACDSNAVQMFSIPLSGYLFLISLVCFIIVYRNR